MAGHRDVAFGRSRRYCPIMVPLIVHVSRPDTAVRLVRPLTRHGIVPFVFYAKSPAHRQPVVPVMDHFTYPAYVVVPTRSPTTRFESSDLVSLSPRTPEYPGTRAIVRLAEAVLTANQVTERV